MFFQLGDLLRKTGELDEAGKVLTAGLEHHPRYVAAWLSLGRVHLEEGEYTEAERAFARALELDPENGVAARLIGETAERIGEWVRAIKAYKLARALSPQDPELEERIAALERRLHPPAEEPEEPDEIFEVSALEDPLPDEESGHRVEVPEPAVRAPRPAPVVFAVEEGDPFAVRPTGDTGVFMLSDDVFAPFSPSEADGADVFGPAESDEAPDTDFPAEDGFGETQPEFEVETDETAVEIEAVAVDEPDAVPVEAAPEAAEEGTAETEADRVSLERDLIEAHEAAPSDDVADVEKPGPAPEVEIASLSDYQPPAAEAVDGDSAGPDGLEMPLPTLTLARLAMEQGDPTLATDTVRAILDRDPGNTEALAMLETLESGRSESGAEAGEDSSPVISVAVVPKLKAQVLRRWMADVRAVAERGIQ